MNATSKYLVFLTMLLLPFAQIRIMLFGVPIYVPEALISCLSVAFCIAVRTGDISIRRVPRLVVAGNAFLLLGAVISSASSGFSVMELGALKSWIVFPMAFGYLVFQTMADGNDRRRMIGFWYIGIVLTATVSLLPFPFVKETYDGRLASFFPSPNHLAFFLEPGILLAAFLSVESAGRRFFRVAIFSMVGAIPVVIALTRTASLGAMVATAAALSVFFSMWFFSRVVRVRLGLAALCVLAMVASYSIPQADIAKMGAGVVRTSIASRVMIWSASARMLASHPIFGIGLRNFEREYLALQSEFPPYLEWAVPHPHNIVLALWLMTGAMGLAGFALLAAGLFRGSRSAYSCAVESSDRLLSITSLAFLLLFMIHGLVDTPFFRNDLSTGFFAVAGSILAFQRPKYPVRDGAKAVA
ncbi:MAG TPA: O-antigen ligase family protein [Candidatus Fimivivens sp.]|nr:O-antigen ligase family protein [Candidatus Fimivivens sp.]